MIKVKLYILSVLLLLVSCTGNKVIDEQITRADSLMEANSDSALVALGMLDSLRKNNPKMSKAQQMRFDLIYAKGMNKGFVDFTTDSVMKQVVAYYDQHGSANERMLAYYLLGCTYRDLDDSPASLDCYLQATEQADTLFSGNRNPGVRYYTYFYAKGLSYLNVHSSDSAKIYFQRCSNMAESQNAKRVAFDGWYKFYKQRHQLDSIIKYADLFIQYSDSVRAHNEVEAMSQTAALYNYSQWQKKAKVQEIENNRARMVILLMIVLVIVLIVVVILYVKNLRKERQIRKEQLLFVKQQIIMKEQELQKSQDELAKMKNELSSKSSLVLDKEKSIMMLKDKIEALTNDCPQDNNESYAIFQQKAMVIKFRELAEKGIEPSSQQWDVLDNIFESFFKQFRLSLEKNSRLNENEYRICMLVWLGFAPNQMKILMNMSSSNISNIRKRLSKKLFDKEMTTSKFDDEIRKIRTGD